MSVDLRPKFGNRAEFKVRKRLNKISALAALKTPEARAERKRMNVHMYGRTKVNLTGFFHPNGRKPIRCK